ncbi:hypothetical protein OPV22_011917 [Ensete ventricosum]|uniref:Uncharacterized protein n=1 Tax=Ensete ventricosum TaxID=4639 RepID=A0AAV8Q6M4_ENSVE|nr:hypothetical protein OPV22_011917 [Ensete ventricosum]
MERVGDEKKPVVVGRPRSPPPPLFTLEFDGSNPDDDQVVLLLLAEYFTLIAVDCSQETHRLGRHIRELNGGKRSTDTRVTRDHIPGLLFHIEYPRKVSISTWLAEAVQYDGVILDDIYSSNLPQKEEEVHHLARLLKGPNSVDALFLGQAAFVIHALIHFHQCESPVIDCIMKQPRGVSTCLRLKCLTIIGSVFEAYRMELQSTRVMRVTTENDGHSDVGDMARCLGSATSAAAAAAAAASSNSSAMEWSKELNMF